MSIPNQYFLGHNYHDVSHHQHINAISLFFFHSLHSLNITSTVSRPTVFIMPLPPQLTSLFVPPSWWPSHFLQLCFWFPHSALLSVLWSPSSSSPPMSCSRVISVFTLTLLLDGLTLPSISRRICPQYPLSPLITFSRKLEQMGHLSPSDLIWSNLIQSLIFLLFLSSSLLSGGNSPSWDTMNDWKFTALHRGLKNKKSTTTVCPLSVLTGEEVTCVLGESPYVHRLDLKCWLDTMVREYFERTPQSSSRIQRENLDPWWIFWVVGPNLRPLNFWFLKEKSIFCYWGLCFNEKRTFLMEIHSSWNFLNSFPCFWTKHTAQLRILP